MLKSRGGIDDDDVGLSETEVNSSSTAKQFTESPHGTECTPGNGTAAGKAFMTFVKKWLWKGRSNWGKMRDPQRSHYHLSRIFEAMQAGLSLEAQTYAAQLLRPRPPVALEKDAWAVAQNLLPVLDPIFKDEPVGTPEELETTSGFCEGVGKLREKQGSPDPCRTEDEAFPNREGPGGGWSSTEPPPRR